MVFILNGNSDKVTRVEIKVKLIIVIFVTGLDLNKCLKEIANRTCKPVSELPSNISTMIYIHSYEYILE